MEVIRLQKEQIEELNQILHLINQYKVTPKENTDEIMELTKMISVRHVITKGYLTPEVQKMLPEDDLKFVKKVNDEMWKVLKPIYDFLTDKAVKHCEEWYEYIQRRQGVGNPRLFKYQKDLMRWLLSAIIKHEMPEAVYTLLISRGSGKTFILSLVGSFLLIFHKMYILHNNFGDYVEMFVAPFITQLDNFIGNVRSNIELSMTTDDEVGLIGRNENDESLLGLYRKFDSQKRVEIWGRNSGVHSTAYFILGASSAESKHANLLLADESKFLSKRVLHGSLLPTTGSRQGIFCMLSSAHDVFSEFQAQVERNIIDDLNDIENGHNIEIITWDGKPLDKNRIDMVKVFNGRRHFQQHWEHMVLHNQGYALSVAKELRAVENNRDDKSFATMYDNKFLSRKSSSFFDIKDLRSSFKTMFEDDNINKYLESSKYFLVGGWDVAITTDFSRLTIKAIESGYGENRKSKLIAQFVLNPTKNKNIDNLLSQCQTVVDIIKEYNLKALAIDESGVGKSAKQYIIDMLLKERYIGINPQNIFDIVITSGNRVALLDYYYNRLQSGLESFPAIPKEWEDDEYLKKLYVNHLKALDSKSQWIAFVFEHLKFTRTDIKDEKTGQIKTVYAQSSENYLHDDTIFSSLLASIILQKNPTITAVTNSSVHTNKGRFSVNRFKR